MADLKPCPVCHGRMRLTKVTESYGMDGGNFTDWIVVCDDCPYKFRFPADDFYGRKFYISPEEAIQHGNKKIETWEKRRDER